MAKSKVIKGAAIGAAALGGLSLMGSRKSKVKSDLGKLKKELSLLKAKQERKNNTKNSNLWDPIALSDIRKIKAKISVIKKTSKSSRTKSFLATAGIGAGIGAGLGAIS